MTSSFATCDLCDAHKNDAPAQFRVLPPVFKDFGARRVFCGPVVTVKCFEDNTLVKAAVDSCGFGWWWMVRAPCAVRCWVAIWAQPQPKMAGLVW
ncbi:MAG: regulator of ribonuclease activity A [Comamonadaceae bacterium]|nr:MAG: regulator of ribonuclease activity A [Comamonadaceae bacterium]